jgi:hypothetical protein
VFIAVTVPSALAYIGTSRCTAFPRSPAPARHRGWPNRRRLALLPLLLAATVLPAAAHHAEADQQPITTTTTIKTRFQNRDIMLSL